MFNNNEKRINFVVAVTAIIFIYVTLIRNVSFVTGASTTTTIKPVTGALRDECGHVLKKHSGLDIKFWKKFFKHWIPFTDKQRVKMKFYLYKKDFPECGRQIETDNPETLEQSGFNAAHPTRIIIHGWLSQSGGSLGRDVKNAYLSLTKPQDSSETNNSSTSSSSSSEEEDDHDRPIDYNIIVVDWSPISTNVNYFAVVDMIDDLAFLLVEFIRLLQTEAGLMTDDVYLIGHSLGAQIAGSAGKQIRPLRFNTIYALDPAGPKFRNRSEDNRIDASDANYVESIMTSSSFGYRHPVGHATFYPNYGHDQKNCKKYGCSHSRAHDYFAESIISSKGFWGVPCMRQSKNIWVITNATVFYRMGGEPSTPKRGTFLVETNERSPYAMGRALPILRVASSDDDEEEGESETDSEEE